MVRAMEDQKMGTQSSTPIDNMAEAKPTIESLGKNLLEMYEQGFMTDTDITVHGKTYHLHKAILAARSKELWNALKEGKDLELSPKLTGIFFRYLYSGKIDEEYLKSNIASVKRIRLRPPKQDESKVEEPSQKQEQISFSIEEVLQLARVASTYTLPGLAELCYRALIGRMQPVNVIQMVKDCIPITAIADRIRAAAATYIATHLEQVHPKPIYNNPIDTCFTIGRHG